MTDYAWNGNCPGMEMASTEGKRQRERCFFEKKNQKILQIQAEPLRKGRSQLSKSFLLLFSKKKAFLLLASPAAAYLGSYLERVGR